MVAMSRTPATQVPGPDPTGDWSRIETWLFDLDNTLYAPAIGVLDQVDRLMTDFIMRALGVARDRADYLRRHYWQTHGATLTGLVAEHGVDPDEFLSACHRLDLSGLAPDPLLATAIDNLPGRRVVHTNGPRHHAERVLEMLGLSGHFERVIALEDTGYVPKPASRSHALAVDLAACAPETTAMIDDTAHNLRHPAGMGMTTIWLRHDPGPPCPDHVHHQIDDLAGFLTAISRPA